MSERLPRQVTASFVALIAFFTIALGGLGYVINQNRTLARQAKETAELGQQAHNGLCVLKADERDRVRDGESFIKQHPEGLAGISAATIQQSLDNQKKTIAALSAIRCTKAESHPAPTTGPAAPTQVKGT